MNLKESINLIKYIKRWGILNTLFKCMSLDKMKNFISFNLDLLNDDENEKTVDITKVIKNNKLNDNNNLNINNIIPSHFDIRKVSSRIKSLREKEENNVLIKYRDNNYSLRLLNFSLRKTNITPINSEEKYLIVPPELLNNIMSIKYENEIFNLNFTDIPIMAKYIGESINYILFSKESNNITEENKMLDDVDDGKLLKMILQKKKEEEKEKEVKKPETSGNKPIILSSKYLQSVPNFEEDNAKIKIEKKEEIKNNLFLQKRYSTKYVFHEKLFINRDIKRRVSITNMNELNRNRFENLERDILRKRTFVRREINF